MVTWQLHILYRSYEPFFSLKLFEIFSGESSSSNRSFSSMGVTPLKSDSSYQTSSPAGGSASKKKIPPKLTLSTIKKRKLSFLFISGPKLLFIYIKTKHRKLVLQRIECECERNVKDDEAIYFCFV